MATSASVTSSSRGSRANVAGPANRGTTLASTGPTRPSVLTRGGLSLIRWLSSGGREGVRSTMVRPPGAAVAGGGVRALRAVRSGLWHQRFEAGGVPGPRPGPLPLRTEGEQQVVAEPGAGELQAEGQPVGQPARGQRQRRGAGDVLQAGVQRVGGGA